MGTFSSAPIEFANIAKLQNNISSYNKYAQTVPNSISAVQSLINKPNFVQDSIRSILEARPPKPVTVDNTDTSETGGFGNMKNQILGMGVNILGQQLGSSVGGKFGDDIGSIGSVIGQQLLENGNLKGLFNGGSGQALEGIGYNMLNKFMGGDKNKDVGSKLLTDFGAMAWQVSPLAGAITTGIMALNNLTGKNTHKFNGNSWQNQEVQSALGGSYGNSMATIKNAQNREGRMGGLGRITGELSRSNRRIDSANGLLADMNTIYDTRELGQIRGQNMADINSLDYRLNTFGGYDQYGTRIGRKGMKLPTQQDIQGVRSIIKMQRGRKYNSYHTGDYCEYPDCATFSNRTVRGLKDPDTGKNYTSYGDAWALNDVDVVYNGYDIQYRPSGKKLNEIKMYNFNTADNLKRNFNSSTLDKNQVYLVNMFYKPTPHWNDAFNNGTRGVAGTHTGYLYYDGNEWMVAHNIHHNIHVDPFLSVQGSGGQYGVTSIFKPLVGKGRKTGLFGLGWGIFGKGGVINSFKKGGQMSVIPEGALHARLHHMETGNKITKKGIPVIDKSGEQQAEIERNEIIFSLEVTNKLEELRKDGSDEAALEAGKLLVDEIFHNTDDRTGLIQEVIGTDEAKKGVFKEGGIIAEIPNFAIQAEEPEIEKFQDGGIIAEEPGMESDDEEEIEEYQNGGIIEQLNNLSEDKLKELEIILKYLNHD